MFYGIGSAPFAKAICLYTEVKYDNMLDFIDVIVYLLSHLLVAGCDIGVRFSVRPSVRPSVNIYVDVRLLCQS